MCIFTLTLSAQSFMDGAQASSVLLSESSTIRTQIQDVMANENLNTSEQYFQKYPEGKATMLLMDAMVDLKIQPSDSPAKVEETLLTYVAAVRNVGIHTTEEVDAMHQGLLRILTQ